MREAWVTSSICAEFIIRRVLILRERNLAIYNSRFNLQKRTKLWSFSIYGGWCMVLLAFWTFWEIPHICSYMHFSSGFSYTYIHSWFNFYLYTSSLLLYLGTLVPFSIVRCPIPHRTQRSHPIPLIAPWCYIRYTIILKINTKTNTNTHQMSKIRSEAVVCVKPI